MGGVSLVFQDNRGVIFNFEEGNIQQNNSFIFFPEESIEFLEKVRTFFKGEKEITAFEVYGLLLISFTWYGVNYLVGAGLHNYGERSERLLV